MRLELPTEMTISVLLTITADGFSQGDILKGLISGAGSKEGLVGANVVLTSRGKEVKKQEVGYPLASRRYPCKTGPHCYMKRAL